MTAIAPACDVGAKTPAPRPALPLRLTASKFPLLPEAAEAMALGLVVSDATRPDMPIVYCNPGFERLTGYRHDEVIGRNCRFLQGPDTDQRELDRLRTAVRAGRSCAVVLRNYRKDRTPFWNALDVTPLTGADGRVTHFVGVQTDITRVKELEAQLAQAQKMELVGRLTGGVAHDFNNLLTVITGFTEAALDHLSDADPARAMLTEVLAASERAAGLTQQLLTFSRRGGAVRATADLNPVVAACAGMLRQLLGRGIEVVVRYTDDLPPVAAAPGQVEQVLLNLAVNARDAMPDGGRVIIGTTRVVVGEADPGHPDVRPGEYVVLRVEDTGRGMDATTAAHIFEPFFTTKPAGRGTGLGLSTVADIVRVCGGHIRVESEPARGATFLVYWPKAVGGAEPSLAAAEEYALRGSEVVLVADDDTAVRAVMSLALRSRGYTVLEAASTNEALQIARSHPGAIDLAVSDALMTGARTGTFFASLREAQPGVRTLAVSGYLPAQAPDGWSGHFLAKPFSTLSLMTKVRQVLDAK